MKVYLFKNCLSKAIDGYRILQLIYSADKIITENKSKPRYIVLTDINSGIEVNDIESMVRLMLYSNDIDIEGLMATTSIWLKDGADKKHRQMILDIHADGYPDSNQLKCVAAVGTPKFGNKMGDGWVRIV